MEEIRARESYPTIPLLVYQYSQATCSPSDLINTQWVVKTNDQWTENSDLNRFIIKHYSSKCVNRTHPHVPQPSKLSVGKWSQGCFVSPGHSLGRKWSTFAVLLMECVPCTILKPCTRFPCTGDGPCCTGNLLMWRLNAYVYIDVFFILVLWILVSISIIQASCKYLGEQSCIERVMKPLFSQCFSLSMCACDREGGTCVGVFMLVYIYVQVSTSYKWLRKEEKWRQRRKGKIYPTECRVPENSKER